MGNHKGDITPCYSTVSSLLRIKAQESCFIGFFDMTMNLSFLFTYNMINIIITCLKQVLF